MMADTKLQFRIEGEGSEDAAEALARWIEADWGIAPALLESRQAPAEAGAAKTDPIALAALILSIPSVILATVDLIDRIKKKEKLDTLLEQTRKLQQEHSTLRIRVITPGGTVLELENTTSAQLLDAAAEIKQKK